MLRPPPTQIGLNTRDLVWHADRHRSRQTRRAHGNLSRAAQFSTDAPASTADHHHTKLAYRFPRRPSKTGDAYRGSDEALISDEAVPQHSRLFWDGIMANAQTRSAGSPAFLTQPFSGSLVSAGARRDSHESHFEGSQTLDIESETEDDGDPDHSDSSCLSSDSANLDAVEEKTLNRQSRQDPPKDVQSQEATSRRRLSFRNFYRRARQGSSKDRTSRDHHASTHNDLDGSSDQISRHRSLKKRSPGADREPSAKPGPTRSRRGRRTDPSTLEVDPNVEEGKEIPRPSPLISEPFDRSSPPTAMPRALEMVIRRTSGLPRSPLHIAQAARSSSPEKRARSPSGSTDAAGPSPSSFLARPPRRRRKYKPRSESYSFVASEISQEPLALTPSDDDDDDDGSDDGLAPNTPKPFDNTPSTDAASSSPDPLHPHHFPPAATTSPPRPGPFSTHPRTVSFNLALPPSPSPSSSPFPSPPSPPAPTPLPLAPSPPPPTTTPARSSMRIYNDALPRTSQPQTPHTLRRHGVVRPSYTAPAAGPARERGRYVGRGTPVSVGRRGWGWGSEQENEGDGGGNGVRMV